MSLIVVENGALSFGDRRILSDLSFAVSDGDRIGLVGDNGCGKSTLAKVLLGDIELDSGKVVRRHGLTIGHMPQSLPEDLAELGTREALLAALPAGERDLSFWKVDVALDELGFSETMAEAPVATLSGGWQRLVLAARAALCEPDLLILDEPTNHLDLGKILRFEAWLRDSVSQPYILISHDRDLLDNVTDKTFFLRHDGLHIYAAAFSTARAELLQADATALRSRQQEDKAIERLERAAQRLRIWSNQKGPNPKLAQRARGVQSRAEQLKARQTDVYKARRRDIDLHADSIRANAALRIHDAVIETPDGQRLFAIENLVVRRGDRVALLGANGSGKSCLIQRLRFAFAHPEIEDVPDRSSRIVFNPQLSLGYLDQHLQDLPLEHSPSALLRERFSLSNSDLVRRLNNIGLPVNEQNKPIDRLSNGERGRLAFLLLYLQKPNFYLLDEPTNHLDIQGQERLEGILESEGHSCIFVSHDRRMVRGVPNRYLQIDKGRLREVDDAEAFFEAARENAEEGAPKRQGALTL